MVGKKARLTAAVVAAGVAAGFAVAESPAYVADGSCRDGVAHGRYELRTPTGSLRASGAFNHGRRTGSFIFWDGAGARVAHIPYDDDARSGTLATWYPPRADGADVVPRFESAFRHGARDGLTRTWYRDGHRRSEAEFAGGEVVAVAAWSDAGAKLPARAAREIVERDARDATAMYDALEALVGANLPRCDATRP